LYTADFVRKRPLEKNASASSGIKYKPKGEGLKTMPETIKSKKKGLTDLSKLVIRP
jgi:hypothetical protein